jgi:hypothetical protein
MRSGSGCRVSALLMEDIIQTTLSAALGAD